VPASHIYSFTPAGFFGWNVANDNNNLGVSPKITLHRGTTYRFQLQSASGHTLALSLDAFTNSPTLYTGVTGFPLNTGNVTNFVLPSNAPNTLFYICTVHSSMAGEIEVVP
jgi:plastocyanin